MTFITPFRRLTISLAIGAALTLPAQAQNLQNLYDLARGYDAAYLSAKSQFEANLAKAEQARANILPTVNMTASASSTNLNTESSSPAPVTTPNRSFDNQSTSISASQPLYRPANLALYEQSKKLVDQSKAQLETAEQELIVRVSQAYFDVLASQDNLAFVKAQKIAVAEQLASAKRNFEVGTSTITDTREAQARYDLVIAQEIAAENDLRVKYLAAMALVNLPAVEPKPLATTRLPEILPADVNFWVTQSQDIHPLVRLNQANLETTRLQTEQAKAGHKPTLDLTASYNLNSNVGGSNLTAASTRTNSTSVGLQFALPLFAGFATQNRIKETLLLQDKAQSDLNNALRTVAQATRAAYFGVVSGLGQVKALEAAEVSSQSALDANKLGYQVGVRINIDVLNSQSQLFQTKRDLAKARYDVLVGGLKLRQANGSLKAEDLQSVNSLLAK